MLTFLCVCPCTSRARRKNAWQHWELWSWSIVFIFWGILPLVVLIVWEYFKGRSEACVYYKLLVFVWECVNVVYVRPMACYNHYWGLSKKIILLRISCPKTNKLIGHGVKHCMDIHGARGFDSLLDLTIWFNYKISCLKMFHSSICHTCCLDL